MIYAGGEGKSLFQFADDERDIMFGKFNGIYTLNTSKGDCLNIKFEIEWFWLQICCLRPIISDFDRKN